MTDVVKLRQWQCEAIDAAEAALAKGEHAVIQAIMGAGKSVALSELAARAFKRGLHVVITVPNQELVRQLAETVSSWMGQVVGRWYADEKDLWPITVVCQMSIEQYEQAWREKYNAPSRLWIADECHKTECDTMLAWDAPTKRIGFTATPWRSEMRESISLFTELVYEYGAERAYADGHVVKPTLHHPKPGDIDEVVAAWIAQQGGGGAVNASSIKDAQQFATRLDNALVVHSQNENDAARAREHIADGGAVVYVDMLAEGFNAPEILWMALRRPVGSRVRFAQEVGRGLRACKRIGKATCHMLDVHDLWGAHSMSWQAALGEPSDVPVPALQLDWMIDTTGSTPSSIEQEQLPPELLSPLRSWLRHERVQALFEGRIDGKEIKTRGWRSDPCSRKQLAYLDGLMRQVNPEALDEQMVWRVRIARAALIDCLQRDPRDLKNAFRKGDAADLIDVVRGMK